MTPANSTAVSAISKIVFLVSYMFVNSLSLLIHCAWVQIRTRNSTVQLVSWQQLRRSKTDANIHILKMELNANMQVANFVE